MKGTNYEGSHRVPMITRWPGTIPAGHVSDQLAIMMDLFATVLHVTGAKMRDDRTLEQVFREMTETSSEVTA